MIATSTSAPPCTRSCVGPPGTNGPECERHDLVAVGVSTKWHQDELHLDSVLEALRLRQARFDPHPVRELDIADPVRHESGARGPGVRGAGRRELLGRPCPQTAAPRQQVLRHLRCGAARARTLRRERDDAACATPAADQPGLVGWPRENSFRYGDSSHHHLRSSVGSASDGRRLLIDITRYSSDKNGILVY